MIVGTIFATISRMPTRAERQQHRTLSEAYSISTELRGLFEPIPPQARRKYTEIENMMGTHLLERFPTLFTPQQQGYLTSPIMLILNEDSLHELDTAWRKSRGHQHMPMALGGKYYLKYEPISRTRTVDEITGETTTRVERSGTHIGATFTEGSIPTYIIDPKENAITLDERYFYLPPHIPKGGSTQDWQNYYDSLIAYNEATTGLASNIDQETLSRRFAETVVHEKIHGLQNPRIPIPIVETQARYFAKSIMDIFTNASVKRQELGFDRAINLYANLVREYGDDVHRVIFGTAPPAVVDSLQPIIFQAFADNMDSLFPNIEWTTIEFDYDPSTS